MLIGHWPQGACTGSKHSIPSNQVVEKPAGKGMHRGVLSPSLLVEAGAAKGRIMRFPSSQHVPGHPHVQGPRISMRGVMCPPQSVSRCLLKVGRWEVSDAVPAGWPEEKGSLPSLAAERTPVQA